MLSLFVLTIRNVLEISTEEIQTLNVLLRLKSRDDLKKEAANVITSFSKYALYKNKKQKVKAKNTKERDSFIKLKRFMNKFKFTQQFIKKTIYFK